MENKLEPKHTLQEVKIKAVKEVRVELDDILQRIKESDRSRENSLTITKIQEAIMWQGMELKRLGAENPYPNSYKSENAVVDKTADGLKL